MLIYTFRYPLYTCALIGRFGSRWALLVLLTLHEGGVLRFGELVRAVPGGISERMLSAALRDGSGRTGRTEGLSRSPAAGGVCDDPENGVADADSAAVARLGARECVANRTALRR